MENCSWQHCGLISEYIEAPDPNVNLLLQLGTWLQKQPGKIEA